MTHDSGKPCATCGDTMRYSAGHCATCHARKRRAKYDREKETAAKREYRQRKQREKINAEL